MNTAIIDLKKDSPAFIQCLKAMNEDHDELLQLLGDICSKNDKKNVFIWSNMNHVTDYLEGVRKRSMLCWFYIIFDIIDKTTDNYNIKLLISSALMPTASQAMELYRKKISESH